MDTAIYAAIMGAAVGGIIAFAGGMVTGLLLYWLEGKRLKRKWQREDAVRHEQWLREDGLREAEWNREEVLRREQSLRRSIEEVSRLARAGKIEPSEAIRRVAVQSVNSIDHENLDIPAFLRKKSS